MIKLIINIIMMIENIITKNGDILFNMEAFAKGIFPSAQKLHTSPISPVSDLKNKYLKLPFFHLKLCLFFIRITVAKTSATAFLKKLFSNAGISPAILTNIFINEKLSADKMIYIIALYFLFNQHHALLMHNS